MRFGLQIPQFAYGVPDERMFEEVAARAQAAEESGFHSVWVMDHFWQLRPLGGPEAPILEAYVTLGALASRTRRVRLGTLVTGNTYRNPALVAKMVTTLDVISGGRAICGIGAAWYEEEHRGLGFDFPPVAERFARLEEAVQVIRLMFREEAPSFAGRYYRIENARNVPRPIQPGGPPIMIGGGGERRTLRLVAQYADLCNVGGTLEVTARKIEVLRRHCKEVGRDPAEVEVTRLAPLFLTDSDEQTRSVREMVERAAGAEEAAAFHIGRPDEVLEQVAALAELGVDELIVSMPLASAGDIRRAGEVLSSLAP